MFTSICQSLINRLALRRGPPLGSAPRAVASQDRRGIAPSSANAIALRHARGYSSCAVDPKPRTSCNGTTASAAFEQMPGGSFATRPRAHCPGALHITPIHTALVLRTHLVPTACRVVIVRTGIHDAIVDTMVR